MHIYSVLITNMRNERAPKVYSLTKLLRNNTKMHHPSDVIYLSCFITLISHVHADPLLRRVINL